YLFKQKDERAVIKALDMKPEDGLAPQRPLRQEPPAQQFCAKLEIEEQEPGPARPGLLAQNTPRPHESVNYIGDSTHQRFTGGTPSPRSHGLLRPAVQPTQALFVLPHPGDDAVKAFFDSDARRPAEHALRFPRVGEIDAQVGLAR